MGEFAREILVKTFTSKSSATLHVWAKSNFEGTKTRKNAARDPICVFSLLSVTQGEMKRDARSELGHLSVTTATVALDAFRVLTRNTQVLRLFWAKKIDRLCDLFIIGAQKRTRTSTPYGTRT